MNLLHAHIQRKVQELEELICLRKCDQNNDYRNVYIKARRGDYNQLKGRWFQSQGRPLKKKARCVVVTVVVFKL